MQRSCAQCNQGFEISTAEQSLHAKINESFEVGLFPLTTLCHDCRLQRKMIWRNERYLYHRTCDSSGKKILSVYPQDAPL